MKSKLLLVLAGLLLILPSCTEQRRTKLFGGKMTIDLPKGERLMMSTWKGDNLFLLTEPMGNTYVPQTKVFKEYSSWGVFESEVKIVEHK